MIILVAGSRLNVWIGLSVFSLVHYAKRKPRKDKFAKMAVFIVERAYIHFQPTTLHIHIHHLYAHGCCKPERFVEYTNHKIQCTIP